MIVVECMCAVPGGVTIERYTRYEKYLNQNELKANVRNFIEYFFDKDVTQYTLNLYCYDTITGFMSEIVHVKNDISDKYNHDYNTGNVVVRDRDEFIEFAEQLRKYYNDNIAQHLDQEVKNNISS